MDDLTKFLPIEKFKEYYFLLEQEKVGEHSLLDTLREHLRIYRSNIDSHYEQSPAIMAFWAGAYEREKLKHERLKRKYERTWATAYIRQKSTMAGRTSETEIKNHLIRLNSIKELQDQLDVLSYKVGLLRAVCDVMHMRNENVINLGASLRKEMDGRDFTKARAVRRAAIKSIVGKV